MGGPSRAKCYTILSEPVPLYGLALSHGNVNRSVSTERADNNHFSAELEYSLCFA